MHIDCVIDDEGGEGIKPWVVADAKVESNADCGMEAGFLGIVSSLVRNVPNMSWTCPWDGIMS